MANRRDTFAKRQREADLKEKARTKQARRLAKRNEPRAIKGPEIGWDEAFHIGSEGASPAVNLPAPAGGASADDPATPTD
jgi:hypothetical protein